MQDHHETATMTLDPPATLEATRRQSAGDRLLSILGVGVTDVTRRRAIELLEGLIRQYDGRARSVCFVNAHTLHLAADDGTYREVLNAADYVFGDGTGVRWASRLQGTRVQDNLVGTDLVPALFRETAGSGYRYFLLGADEGTIQRAAAHAEETFCGWTQVGYHHGYLADPGLDAEVVRRINQARPDVLLVGMGNPLQERWIHRHRHELDVPVCVAVGGLFSYWAGELRRAPLWMRRCGSEWVGILVQQPHKARRYLLGNWLFLMRILCETWAARQRRLGRPS
jgi:N-acetylglucosaminyldiphosphoundecaprenol N-acetyl-beta-D-mannosaminyltransferase